MALENSGTEAAYIRRLPSRSWNRLIFIISCLVLLCPVILDVQLHALILNNEYINKSKCFCCWSTGCGSKGAFLGQGVGHSKELIAQLLYFLVLVSCKIQCFSFSLLSNILSTFFFHLMIPRSFPEWSRASVSQLSTRTRTAVWGIQTHTAWATTTTAAEALWI